MAVFRVRYIYVEPLFRFTNNSAHTSIMMTRCTFDPYAAHAGLFWTFPLLTMKFDNNTGAKPCLYE